MCLIPCLILCSVYVEAQAALPMAAVWGTGRTASSDGQFFPASITYQPSVKRRTVTTTSPTRGRESCMMETHIFFGVSLTREEWKNLIEDPRITLDILKYFARDEVGFPANVMVQRELDAAFPQYSLVTLTYHVFCAMKSGLLVVASYDIRDTHERAEINIGHIVGLTSAGSDYVRDSRTKLWDTAMAKLTDAGLEATTGRLVEVLPKIAIQMLQL